MDPQKELEALDAERVTLLEKANTPDFTEEDADRADEVVKRIGELKGIIAKRDAATARLRAAGVGKTAAKSADPDGGDDAPATGGLGDRFVASAAYKSHRSENPQGVNGGNVRFKASDLGGLVAKAEGDPAAIGTNLGGAIDYVRQPGIVDLTYPKRPTLLDLITRGRTSSAYVEFRRLIAVTSKAAVVPERGLKPLSELTTDTAQAIAHVIADGFKVTNQELEDDGLIASLLNSLLARNIWEKLEDLVLNGTGTNEPRGILNTSGVLTQAFDTDLVTTTRKSITTLRETSGTDVQAFVLSPEDDEALDLLQDGNDRYYGGGPFGSGPSTLWGRPRVVSPKLDPGTFLAGDFRSIQLLERHGLAVEAFNQNEDDARHNLVYLRAEVRELLLVREPARLLVGAGSATAELPGGEGEGEGEGE